MKVSSEYSVTSIINDIFQWRSASQSTKMIVAKNVAAATVVGAGEIYDALAGNAFGPWD